MSKGCTASHRCGTPLYFLRWSVTFFEVLFMAPSLYIHKFRCSHVQCMLRGLHVSQDSCDFYTFVNDCHTAESSLGAPIRTNIHRANTEYYQSYDVNAKGTSLMGRMSHLEFCDHIFRVVTWLLGQPTNMKDSKVICASGRFSASMALLMWLVSEISIILRKFYISDGPCQNFIPMPPLLRILNGPALISKGRGILGC